jgi:hypothetical protein
MNFSLKKFVKNFFVWCKLLMREILKKFVRNIFARCKLLMRESLKKFVKKAIIDTRIIQIVIV